MDTSNKLTALYVARNEQDLVKLSIESIVDFVDEIIFVDTGSSDKTKEIAKEAGKDKIKIFDYPYSEPFDMGKARTFSLQQATGEWFLQIDADEIYPKTSMEKILEDIKDTDAISIRVKYYNVAWRYGYIEPIEHYPDRLYKREVVEKYHGILPLDMTIVKPEYRLVKQKGKGIEGVLEYDNPDDRSFEHPKQPIRKDIYFYHLARARGHWFEFQKRFKYEKFTHPEKSEEENRLNTLHNQWVIGNYSMEKHDFPPEIPQRVIPNPKVSVLVSCYNKGKYVSETLQSILNQTYKPYEVIVVDDGSTDNSAEEIKKYPVEYIYQQNQGVSKARNVALDKMTGDYFILIDGDDKLAHEYIEKTLQEMKGDIQVVWTDFKGLDEWEGMHHQYSGNIEDLKQAQCIPSVMALCDARIRDAYGNFKDNVVYEDYEFWLNVYLNRKANFKHIPEPLCFYRRNTGSRIDELDKRKSDGQAQLNEMFKEFNVNIK